jgi:hypothetical protein
VFPLHCFLSSTKSSLFRQERAQSIDAPFFIDSTKLQT